MLHFISNRENIKRFTYGMTSGIYVKHGMIIDPKTGLITPQQRPSDQALTLF